MNKLSVYNNGNGIPVVMHKEHQIYVPELIFGARGRASLRAEPPTHRSQKLPGPLHLPLDTGLSAAAQAIFTSS